MLRVRPVYCIANARSRLKAVLNFGWSGNVVQEHDSHARVRHVHLGASGVRAVTMD
jgi:hypothetical protein